MKPTIVTIIFSVALLGSLKFGKPLLSMGFNRILKLSEIGWRTLTLRWGFFFFVLAVLNEIVWRTQPTDIWMAYNFHSHLTLTIAFALSQIPLILKSDPAVAS